MLGGDVPERPPPSTPTSSSTSTDQNKETRKLQKNSFPPESWTIDPPSSHFMYRKQAGMNNAGFAASDQKQKFHKTIAFQGGSFSKKFHLSRSASGSGPLPAQIRPGVGAEINVKPTHISLLRLMVLEIEKTSI